MDYDVEREKRKSEEVRKVFREMFPLADESDLPWAICQIKDFLNRRLAKETEERVFHFQRRVVSVLCELSPPKTHVEDMARNVVNAVKRTERERDDANQKIESLTGRLEIVRADRDEMQARLNEIAAIIGAKALTPLDRITLVKFVQVQVDIANASQK